MLRQQEYVGILIGEARRGLKQAVLRLARPLRLTPPQFWFLNAARELPGASLGTIARRQHMDAPTASRVAESLARRGLLRIEPDALDRRAVQVELTAAGLKLAQRIAPIAAGVRGAVVQGMSRREEQALRRALRKVVKNLETLGGAR
jgi:DNA-binding MarR family transcriptional regulator